MKLITEVGMTRNFSQALRAVSRSFCALPPPLRFMNGKSSAHQHRPITGTQISSCLMKNFSRGMRRLNTYCSTRMSTQLWWLLLTRYQPWRRCPSWPDRCQRVWPTMSIHHWLTPTQFSAIALIAASETRRADLKGNTSLSRANGIIKVKPIMVLQASASEATVALMIRTI